MKKYSTILNDSDFFFILTDFEIIKLLPCKKDLNIKNLKIKNTLFKEVLKLTHCKKFLNGVQGPCTLIYGNLNSFNNYKALVYLLLNILKQEQTKIIGGSIVKEVISKTRLVKLIEKIPSINYNPYSDVVGIISYLHNQPYFNIQSILNQVHYTVYSINK